jgi:hypothetical protein
MPIQIISNKAHKMGKVASPSSTGFLALSIPIVPITHLFNVVVIGNKGYMGTDRRVYARNSLKRLGMDMGTRRFL